jgi:hypothetical protein
MERELVALLGLIEQVGTAPRVIADDAVQIVLHATPSAADGVCALWHPDRTLRDVGGRLRQARCRLRPTQRLGSASRTSAAVDGAIPAVREYPLVAGIESSLSGNLFAMTSAETPVQFLQTGRS